MTTSTGWVRLLAILFLCPVGQQMRAESTGSPFSSAIASSLGANLAHRLQAGVFTAKVLSNPSTQFHFDGSTDGFVLVANGISANADQRQSLVETMEKGRVVFEAAAAKVGLENDVASALSAFVAQNWTIVRDETSPDDGARAALARQLRIALETPQLKGARDADKESFYEWLLGMTFVTNAQWGLAKTDATGARVRSVQAVADNALQAVLGLSAQSFDLGRNGLELRQQSLNTNADEPGTTGKSSPSSGSGDGELIPGVLSSGHPLGLFWRFNPQLHEPLAIQTYLFLPDGRLLTALYLNERGGVDWEKTTSAGYVGSWQLRGGRITIKEGKAYGASTYDFVVGRGPKGGMQLQWSDTVWYPATLNPSKLHGHFHTESSGGGSGYYQNAATFSSGDFFFSEDGRFGSNSSAIIAGSANDNSAQNWSGVGGSSAGNGGRYELNGFALVMRGKGAVQIVPFLHLNENLYLIGWNVYSLKP